MKYLAFSFLFVATSASAQYDASKHAVVTVKASNGNTCTQEVEGSTHPSQSTIAAIKEMCERRQRGEAILSVIGPTPRDQAKMTPAQIQAYRCKIARDRIETQKDLEAAGSTGVYSMPMLRQSELEQCGSNKYPY